MSQIITETNYQKYINSGIIDECKPLIWSERRENFVATYCLTASSNA
jgi:hypothetical protein